MKQLIGPLGAAAAGALAMYYLDPQSGAERRAALARALAGDMPIAGSAHRSAGLRVRSIRANRPDAQSDARLRDLVVSRLGRMVTHPRAIDVRVEGGVVRLSGNVLSQERDGLLLQVRELPGVQRLVNALTAHDSPREIVAAS